MGQNKSTIVSDSFFQESVEVVHDEIFRHAKLFTEIAQLTYDEFLSNIDKLNALSSKCLNVEGKKLMFAVKKGTDNTLLWKGTVRIACIKVDTETKQVETCLLNLMEFLKLVKHLDAQISIAEQSQSAQQCSTSSFMNIVDSNKSSEQNIECCICLERKPDVILPCAHSYCLPCIEQWNVNNKTCPICRESLQSTDETWVLSEVPEVSEINEDIHSTLLSLVDKK